MYICISSEVYILSKLSIPVLVIIELSLRNKPSTSAGIFSDSQKMHWYMIMYSKSMI